MNNLNNLIDDLNTSQILVGLDLGTKTIGVSVSDTLKIIATPITTIKRKGIKKDLVKLKEVLNDYEIGGFVIGLPISLDNSENKAETKPFLPRYLLYKLFNLSELFVAEDNSDENSFWIEFILFNNDIEIYDLFTESTNLLIASESLTAI